MSSVSISDPSIPAPSDPPAPSVSNDPPPPPPPPPISDPVPSDPAPSQSLSSSPPTTENSPPPASDSTPSQSPSQPLSQPPPSDTPPPSPSLPQSQPPPIPSQFVYTDSAGGVVTVTSFVSRSQSLPTHSSEAATGNKSFFENKGAVAGTFTVVGLIGLGIIIALITIGIRRRKARQFDDDVAEAAREAAHAKPPIFYDDPADDGVHSYGTQNYVYSDNSHGAYSQAPMGHNVDTYDMGEMNRYGAPMLDAGAAGVGVMRARSRREFDDTPANAGMAGYGAGGGLHNNNYGPGETQSPYPAFAAPGGPQPHEMYENRYAPPSHYNNYTDNAVDTGMTQPVVARQPSQQQHTLARQKSQGGRSLVDGYHPSTAESIPPQPESYASRYQPGYKPDPTNHPMPPPARTSVYQDEDDAYGGVSASHASTNNAPGDIPNPFAQRNSVLEDSDDDSDDRHDGRRVLKVANE